MRGLCGQIAGGAASTRPERIATIAPAFSHCAHRRRSRNGALVQVVTLPTGRHPRIEPRDCTPSAATSRRGAPTPDRRVTASSVGGRRRAGRAPTGLRRRPPRRCPAARSRSTRATRVRHRRRGGTPGAAGPRSRRTAGRAVRPSGGDEQRGSPALAAASACGRPSRQQPAGHARSTSAVGGTNATARIRRRTSRAWLASRPSSSTGQATVNPPTGGGHVVGVALELGGQAGRPRRRSAAPAPPSTSAAGQRRCRRRSPRPTSRGRGRAGCGCGRPGRSPAGRPPSASNAARIARTTRCVSSRGTSSAPSPATSTPRPDSVTAALDVVVQPEREAEASRSPGRGWRWSPAPGPRRGRRRSVIGQARPPPRPASTSGSMTASTRSPADVQRSLGVLEPVAGDRADDGQAGVDSPALVAASRPATPAADAGSTKTPRAAPARA